MSLYNALLFLDFSRNETPEALAWHKPTVLTSESGDDRPGIMLFMSDVRFLQHSKNELDELGRFLSLPETFSGI